MFYGHRPENRISARAQGETPQSMDFFWLKSIFTIFVVQQKTKKNRSFSKNFPKPQKTDFWALKMTFLGKIGPLFDSYGHSYVKNYQNDFFQGYQHPICP